MATLHLVALMDMGRKPFTEAAKERRRIRRMEALLPPHVLHGDDDCNQLVAPFNTESEISHTARSSSDSRTDYDGWPLDRAISGPAWTPSSSYLQPTWAPQPRNCGGDDGRADALAPPVDLAALVQLTAWVERLDAIMRTNDGEDKVILKIRTRAVGVLDSWVGRWELRQRVQE